MLLCEKNATQEDTYFIRSCLSDSDWFVRSEAAALILDSSFSNDDDIERIAYKAGFKDGVTLMIEVQI